jgi:metal-responsive CopG/Arc/MetJ family transcriptional regulator
MERHNAAMPRTTIVLPEDLRKRARRAAAERGVSMSEIIRQALEQSLNQKRPKPSTFGIIASGYTDTSTIAGDVRPKPRS